MESRGEVDRHLPVQLVRRDIGKVGHQACARIIDQNIEPAKTAFDAVKQLPDRLGIGQIAGFGGKAGHIGAHHQQGRGVDVDADDMAAIAR